MNLGIKIGLASRRVVCTLNFSRADRHLVLNWGRALLVKLFDMAVNENRLVLEKGSVVLRE